MSYSRQTFKNFYFNFAVLIVNVGIGLFYTPYLVRTLGIVAYGIVPLALVLNQYIGVLTDSITASLTRFYTIALQQKNNPEASKYLSSSVASIIALIVMLLPVFWLIVTKVDKVFNIPAQYVDDARLLFALMILSFIVSLFSSILNITLYALNRLDTLNFINIIRIVFKVSLTILFFTRVNLNVSNIGLASLISEIIVICLSFFYFKRTTPKEIRISLRYVDKTALVIIFSMTFWILLHQLGDTGIYRIDIVLVNKFWSTRESGILGALSDFGVYVKALISVVLTLFGPLILIAYSRGDHENLISIALNNSLLVGVLSSLIIGLLIGFSKPIIDMWLGEQFVSHNRWFILKLVPLPFVMASGLYNFVYKAWNKITLPALVTLCIGTICIISSYQICSFSNGEERYIDIMLVSLAIFSILQSFGLNAYCFNRIYPKVSVSRFLIIFLKILLTLTVTGFLAFGVNSLFTISNIIQLVIAFVSISLLTVTFTYYIVFDRTDKNNALQLINGLVKREFKG